MRRRRRLAASAWRRLRPGDGMRGASPPVAGQPAVASASSLPSAHAREYCPCSLPRRSSSTSTAPIRWFVQSCIRPEAPDERFGPRELGEKFAHEAFARFYDRLAEEGVRRVDAENIEAMVPRVRGARGRACPRAARAPRGLSPCGDDARGAAAGGAAQAPTGSQPAPAGPRCPRATKWSSASIPSRSPTAWTLPASGCGGASSPRRCRRRAGTFRGDRLQGIVQGLRIRPEGGRRAVRAASRAGATIYAQALLRTDLGLACAGALYLGYLGAEPQGTVGGGLRRCGLRPCGPVFQEKASAVAMNFSAYLDAIEALVADRLAALSRGGHPREPVRAESLWTLVPPTIAPGRLA